MASRKDLESHPNPNNLEGWIDEALNRRNFGEKEYFEGLKAVIIPLLRRPELLRDFVELTEKYAPQMTTEILSSLKAWTECAKGCLDQRETSTKALPVMASRTLAEIFLRQGHFEEAEKIYRILIQKNPEDKGLQEEYTRRFHRGTAKGDENKLLEVLSGLAQRIRLERVRRMRLPGEEGSCPSL